MLSTVCQSTSSVFPLCLRNTVHAPQAVKDQIYDHQESDKASNATKYYLNEEIRFDTQAAFLDRPFNEIVRQLARNMTLTVDLNASITLSPELSEQVANNKRVLQLQRRNTDLIQRLRKKYKIVRLACQDDSLYQRKQQVNANLQRTKSNLRNRMLEKARKDHFRNAGLAVFEAQFGADGVSSISGSDKNVEQIDSSQYDVLERAEIVRLTCVPNEGLLYSEKHTRRLETLIARMRLCNRKKTRSFAQSRSQKTSRISLNASAETSEDELSRSKLDDFPLICKSTHCIFCLGNESKSYTGRSFEYARPSKTMDHVEKHLQGYGSSNSIPCPHSKCRAEVLVLSDIKVFKNHVATVHGVVLRA